MLGHSLGEYTAAALAGVFRLEDALRLVAARGRLLQDLPAGAMIAVGLDEAEARRRLEGGEELAIAAVNEEATTVVSGPTPAIEAFERELAETGLASHRLQTSHAFHSPMMRPAAEALREIVAGLELAPPSIPFISNVSGTWITTEDATDPAYWSGHLLETVRFADGLRHLVEPGVDALLEVGPSTTLSGLARRHPESRQAGRILASLPHPKEAVDAERRLLETAAGLWALGAPIRWESVRGDTEAGRVPLPTYPYERQRFWVEAPSAAPSPAAPDPGATADRLPATEWLNVPTWRRAPQRPGTTFPPGRLLVFESGDDFAVRLASRLGDVPVVRVVAGTSYEATPDGFTIDPRDASHYGRLLADAGVDEDLVVVHDWSRRAAEPEAGFDSLYLAARAVWREGTARRLARRHRRPARRHRRRNARTRPGDDARPLPGHPLRARRPPLPELRPRHAGHRRARRRRGRSDRVGDADRGPERGRRPPWRSPMGPGDDPHSGTRGGTGARGPARLPGDRRPRRRRRCPGRGRRRAARRRRRPAVPRAPIRAGRRILDRPARRGRRRSSSVSRSAGGRVLTLTADVTDADELGAAIEICEGELGPIDLVIHAAGIAGGGAIERRSLDEAMPSSRRR